MTRICSGAPQMSARSHFPHCCHSPTRRQCTGLLVFQFVHDPEGFQELGEVNTAIFVEVDTSSEVVNRLVVDVDTQVGTEETPGLTELLDGDQTWTQFVQYKPDNQSTNSTMPSTSNSVHIVRDLPEWSLSIMLNIISISVLYRNKVSATFGVTWEETGAKIFQYQINKV